ncbi:MAG: acyl-CoA dehydrogenase family protein, partial [Bryobacteraceae bacterium]
MTPELVAEAPAVYPPFTAEHDLIRQTVKRFCREEIAPFAQEWDEAGIFPREIFRKAADLGLFGIRIPTELGGSGLDWWATAAAMESIAWADSPGTGMGLMVQGELTIPI